MDDDRFETVWRVIIVCLAIVCLITLLLYLSHRESLSCSGDKCRELKGKAMSYLATVLGDSFLS